MWARNTRLEELLQHAFREPWLSRGGPLREWLRDPGVLRAFMSRGRLTAVAVGSTPPDLQNYVDNFQRQAMLRGKGLGSSAAAQEEAFMEVMGLIEFLWRQKLSSEDASQVEGAFWPTKGTLLAMLRYGAWHGELSEGKMDIVDRDMDFAVLVSSAETWFRLVSHATNYLREKGWEGCFHHIESWYSDQVWKQDAPGLAWVLGTKTNSGSSSSETGAGFGAEGGLKLEDRKSSFWVVCHKELIGGSI